MVPVTTTRLATFSSTTLKNLILRAVMENCYADQMVTKNASGKVTKAEPSARSAINAFRHCCRPSNNRAGVSAESGVPTFRGADGYKWRTFLAQDLASPTAFMRDPSLVWEFYHYRRELVLTKTPNNGHKAIAEFEKYLEGQGKRLVVITQNIDELHKTAGTKNLIELHGTLFKTRCLECGDVAENRDSPICESLRNKGSPDPSTKPANLPESDLPRCKKCDGLVRPHVVWFGEGLDHDVLDAADKEFDKCDLCLVVGTSAVVYPAAMYGPMLASRGVKVAEFNIEENTNTNAFSYYFEGPSGTTLPEALKVPVV